MDGAKLIRDMLIDCEDPVDEIKNFQTTYGFSTPVIASALPLLDLLGTTRYEFHSHVLSKFTETLLGKLKQLSDEQKGRLLDQIISSAHLQPIQTLLTELLSSFKPVPEHFLELLATNPKAYACCPMPTKRDIWERSSELFCTEVSALTDTYCEEKESLLLSLQESDGHFFDIVPRVRRQHAVLTELVDMVGSSPKLYEVMCNLLRMLFSQSGVAHYCTLRMDVLMVLHEAHHSLVRQDPCHKFMWCLDACVREHKIDEKRVKELSTLISQQDLEGDMAMASHDPYVLHLLCTSAVSLVGDLAKQCKLPRESPTLKVLLRLLNRSLTAVAMFNAESFVDPPLDADVVHRHMSILVGVCSDMDGIALHTTLQAEVGADDDDDDDDSEESGDEFHAALVQPLPQSFSTVLAESPVVLVLTLHLAARTAKRGCSKTLQRLLCTLVAALAEDGVSRNVPGTVWFYFFHELTRMSEAVLADEVSEDLGSVSLAVYVFANLVIPLCRGNAECLGHCLRMLALWPVGVRNVVSQHCDDSWLEALQPNTTHSDVVWRVYGSAYTMVGWPTFYPE